MLVAGFALQRDRVPLFQMLGPKQRWSVCAPFVCGNGYPWGRTRLPPNRPARIPELPQYRDTATPRSRDSFPLPIADWEWVRHKPAPPGSARSDCDPPVDGECCCADEGNQRAGSLFLSLAGYTSNIMKKKPIPTGRERTSGEDEIIVSKTDLRGRITYANEVFQQVSGYTEQKLLGQPPTWFAIPRCHAVCLSCSGIRSDRERKSSRMCSIWSATGTATRCLLT